MAADTRGIIAPAAMLRHVDYRRLPVPDPLVGLVDWFWSVRWQLPIGSVPRQQTLAQPGVNVSVGNPPPPDPAPPPGPYPVRAVVNGVATRISERVLSGTGWNVAAKTSTGGFGAWVDDVKALTDRVAPLGAVLSVDGDSLTAACVGADVEDVVQRLAEALLAALRGRDPQRIALSRTVAAIGRVAESDRSVRRVEQLAAVAGVTPRTLQRMFSSCAGASPTWVIRRFRLLEAADLVRDGRQVDWAGVAAELGYADQAHLTRDFTAAIGRSPAAYARECRS